MSIIETPLSRRAFARAAAAVAACGVAPAFAQQEKIRIGILGPFSGAYALVGNFFRQGIETYVSMNGVSAGDREIELIYRDTAGNDAAAAKRLIETLIVRDKVSLLGGFYLSPEAIAAAPVVNETQTPAVLFFAGASGIPKLSPYYVRTGGANVSHAAVIADFAIKRGLKRVYIAVADFLPGHEMQGVYQARIAAAGGTILGQDRIPLSTVDYAPFAERISGAKPDAVLCFIPNGAPAVAWFKSLGEQGVLAAKIPILGVAETDDSELAKFDNSVAGVAHSTIFYSAGADNDANRKFKEAFAKKFPGASLSAGIATAFDGIHVLYSMVASQKGKPFDKLDAFKAVQGMEWAAPRGPLRIAPGTGDLDTPIFVRRAELVDGKLVNVIVDTVIARAGG